MGEKRLIRIGGDIYLNRNELIDIRDKFGANIYDAVSLKSRNLVLHMIQKAKEAGWVDKNGKILDVGE